MNAKYLTILFSILLIIFSSAMPCFAQTNKTSIELPTFINEAFSNPKVLVAITIQFLLGFGLGYFSLKVIKYIIALIGLIILGSVLSVWSIGGSVENFLAKIGVESQKILPLTKDIATTLGILTVGPVTVGFLVGILVVAMRK